MNSNKVIIAGWYTVEAKKRDEVVESFEDLIKRARQGGYPKKLEFNYAVDG